MRDTVVGDIVVAMRIQECGTLIWLVNAASRCPIEDAMVITIATAPSPIVSGNAGERDSNKE